MKNSDIQSSLFEEYDWEQISKQLENKIQQSIFPDQNDIKMLLTAYSHWAKYELTQNNIEKAKNIIKKGCIYDEVNNELHQVSIEIDKKVSEINERKFINNLKNLGFITFIVAAIHGGYVIDAINNSELLSRPQYILGLISVPVGVVGVIRFLFFYIESEFVSWVLDYPQYWLVVKIIILIASIVFTIYYWTQLFSYIKIA